MLRYHKLENLQGKFSYVLLLGGMGVSLNYVPMWLKKIYPVFKREGPAFRGKVSQRINHKVHKG